MKEDYSNYATNSNTIILKTVYNKYKIENKYY